MSIDAAAPVPIKIDLGCGAAKREGFIGLDHFPAPGVDHVLDLTQERWPFDDGTVDHVYSSHFFEHIFPHDPLFREIGRVCKDGAKIEIWTPYSFSNNAFLYTHVVFPNEDQWLQICCIYPDVYQEVLGGRWLLKNLNFVVLPEIEQDLNEHGFSVDFAIRHLKSVVYDFGIEVEFQRDVATPVVWPKWTYSHSRFGERFAVKEPWERVQKMQESVSHVQQPETKASVSYVQELETTIEQKNQHIRKLEHLLSRIENGRALRVLRRFGL